MNTFLCVFYDVLPYINFTQIFNNIAHILAIWIETGLAVLLLFGALLLIIGAYKVIKSFLHDEKIE